MVFLKRRRKSEASCLLRDKKDLSTEVEALGNGWLEQAAKDAQIIKALELQLEKRDREIEHLLDSVDEQRYEAEEWKHAALTLRQNCKSRYKTLFLCETSPSYSLPHPGSDEYYFQLTKERAERWLKDKR